MLTLGEVFNVVAFSSIARRGDTGTSRLRALPADAPRRAQDVEPVEAAVRKAARTSALGCQAALFFGVVDPLLRYLAPTNCLWSSASVSIWTRRGLTLSLRGSVNRSIP